MNKAKEKYVYLILTLSLMLSGAILTPVNAQNSQESMNTESTLKETKDSMDYTFKIRDMEDIYEAIQVIPFELESADAVLNFTLILQNDITYTATDETVRVMLPFSGKSFFTVKTENNQKYKFKMDDNVPIYSSFFSINSGSKEATVSFENIIFEGTERSGGLNFSGSKTIFNNCDFINNTNLYPDGGAGAVRIDRSSGTFNNCTFKNNKGTSGAINIIHNKQYSDFCMIVNNCKFIDNVSTPGTGAAGTISIGSADDYSSKEVIIKDSLFKGNSTSASSDLQDADAEYEFATVNITFQKVEIDNCHFEDNKSLKQGALSFYGSNATIKNSTFKNNESLEGDGGALHLYESETTVQNSSFIENKALNGRGGAIVSFGGTSQPVLDYSLLNVENSTFKDNKARSYYEFDMNDTSLKMIHNTQIKDIKELSKPFSLSSSVESMRYAYNNADIAYEKGAPLNSYTITFNGNGADAGTSPNSTDAYENEDVFLPMDIELTRQGYKFIGWDENKDATVPTYTNSSNTLVMENKDITLYAVWEMCEYTVSLLDEDNSLLDQSTVNFGESFNIKGTPNKADDENYTYTFESWIPQGNYVLNDLEYITQDMTFVASYKAIEKVTPITPEKPDIDEVNEENKGDVLGDDINQTGEDNSTQENTVVANSVKTSDQTTKIPYLIMFGLSLIGLTYQFIQRKKIKK